MSPAKTLSIAVVVLGIAILPAAAQAPTCTGISDVSDFDGAADSDLENLLTTVRVASGLSRPTFVTSPDGDLDRLFIVEQDGTIRILKNGALLATPFLSIGALVRSPADLGGGNEEGLLSLAFHPDYDDNGWFFVYYTRADGQANEVWRYTVSANPDVADTISATQVISIPHTFASNHNGGQLDFRPNDGRLYVGVGDGGSGCDPTEAGQSLNTNLAKILRLDVDSLPYGTSGNPFDGPTAGNDEIWHYGVRNPWRFSFDRETSALYIGDVGQNVWEEVDCEKPGAPNQGGLNFGWDEYEGSACPNPSCAGEGSCAIPDVQRPITEYDHNTAGFSCSVTGGYVYRGCRMSDLHGTYFYSDFCSAFIKTFNTDASCGVLLPVLDRTSDLDPAGALSIAQITSYGEDAAGELYIVDRGGEVFKIVPELDIIELSGDNAEPLTMGADDWTWEDLEASSSWPISTYKVYRSDTGPTGVYSCVHQTPDPVWIGGDPAVPAAGDPYYYLVTALNAQGQETRPGNQSDGTPRTVDTASNCP